jgi:SsrA-binding protein
MSDIATNEKVRFNYEILETLEAGVELAGIEVKSLRTHGASLDGSYVIVRGGEAFLSNMNIPPYQAANTPSDYDPMRLRRLLLAKKEIADLAAIESKKGLTIVPLSMYNKEGKIKVSVGIVRGKKKFDKRQAIKKRDTERDIGRSLKN